MRSVSYLSDVYGPRLMGTPQYYESVMWAKKTLEDWGVKNVQLQQFDNNHIGWTVENFQIEMSSPNFVPLNAYPLAFTESSDGEKEGEILVVSSFNDESISRVDWLVRPAPCRTCRSVFKKNEQFCKIKTIN